MYPPEGCPPLAGWKGHACHSPPRPVFCPDRPRPLDPGRAAKPHYTVPDRAEPASLPGRGTRGGVADPSPVRQPAGSSRRMPRFGASREDPRKAPCAYPFGLGPNGCCLKAELHFLRATAFEILPKRDIIRNMELKRLKSSLEQIEDPRRTNGGHILHKLEDIIIIGLCTVVCGGEDFPDMEEFGKEREEWLKKFLELPHGIPDSDTFRRVFERIKPEALSECLYDWLGCHRQEGSVIAVDGKTIRGSKTDSHKAYHVVSAFAAENQLVLGEIVTDEKSNEITAVPELLGSLNIENSIITADAMSCQKEIVKKIREGKADYVISLKGNHPALLEDVSLYFEHFSGELPSFVTKVKDHGRLEKRDYRLLNDLSWLPQQAEWDGLQAVGMVTATISRGNETTTDARYFLSSVTDLERFAYAVRKHWSIENQLHWCLDAIFNEDASKACKDMSPLNLNILRKTALALCKNADFGRRLSIQKKRFAAALNPQRLLDILFG